HRVRKRRLSIFLFLHYSRYPRDLHPFPTRRSSDLAADPHVAFRQACQLGADQGADRHRPPGDRVLPEEGEERRPLRVEAERDEQDRKSTRLNSSHVKTSYAVVRLKKKTA